METTVIVNLRDLVDERVSSHIDVQGAQDAVAEAVALSQSTEVALTEAFSIIDGKKDQIENVLIPNAEGILANVSTVRDEIVDTAEEVSLLVDLAVAKSQEAADSATEAFNERENAQRVAALVANIYDRFDDRYYGSLSAPLVNVNGQFVDKDGNPSLTGAMYWNTVENATYVYTGFTWVKVVESSGGLMAGNNLADLQDKAVSRVNLDVYSTGEVDDIADLKYDKTGGTIDGDVVITGDLLVSGDTFTVNTETVLIEDNLLVINNGEVGLGVTKGVAGIEVDRGTADNYQLIFDEASDSFKVGVVGDLQKVATREDIPLNGGHAKWDATTNKFVTSNLASDTMTMTNKTIDSITNYVGADHIHYKVRNSSGSTIAKGTVVKAAGSQPGTDYIVIAPVTANSDVALGVMHTDLANNGVGLVVNTGELTGMSTSAWAVGTILYPNTSGGLTNVRPTSGQYQACAVVLRSHVNQGTLLVEFTEPKLIASTSQMGYVQLNNTLTSTSSTEALTAAQGKVLYDMLTTPIEW